MTADWNPQRYLAFGGERLRPALDLIARIGHNDIETIYDLGCGAGNVTAVLAARWPQARITGVDSSPAMIAQAKGSTPGASLAWRLADLNGWRADRPAGLIFSNAALHWLGDHDHLFARLIAMLAPGGQLAVQMPRNFAAPSHTAIAQVVADGPWRDRLTGLLGPAPVDPLARYHDRLAPLTDALDLWETTYGHRLHDDGSGLHPVAQWTQTTALRPFLNALDHDAERTAFLAAYSARMDAAYPKGVDGTVLFPFTRIFMVARL